MRSTLIAALVAAVIPGTLLTQAVSAHERADDHAEPTIVLVHGAWADGHSWDKVAKRLTQGGHEVVVAPNPLRSPAADATTLQHFLDEHTDGPVVLVGHSYGGTVISGVHDPDVRGQLHIKKEVFLQAFGNDLPRRAAVALADSQEPLTLFAGLEPAGPPAWTATPCWSLVGTIDEVIPVAQQRAMSARAGARTTEVTAGHLSMISKPRAVTAFIERAVRRLTPQHR